MDSEDEEDQHYFFKPGERINSTYWAHSKIGKGSYGTVIRAYDYKNNTDVAIKFMAKGSRYEAITQHELFILDLLHKHNTNNRYGVIMYLDTIAWNRHYGIVLPLYRHNLYHTMKKSKGKKFSIRTVKHVATQLLECLFFFQHPEIKLIHTDIKPDNILFVTSTSSKIKLIDFGGAIIHPVIGNHYIQTLYYRSPEVIMDYAFSYPIDTWSLGCCLVEFITGTPLFNEKDERNLLKAIIEVCGMPPDSFIKPSTKSGIWFSKENNTYNMKLTKSEKQRFMPGCRSLKNIVNSSIDKYQTTDLVQYRFLTDLLEKMLVYDPSLRITPLDALRHPFINSLDYYNYNTSFKSFPSNELRNSAEDVTNFSEQDASIDMNIDLLNTELGLLEPLKINENKDTIKKLMSKLSASSGFIQGDAKGSNGMFL